jgi:hypothetical protein
MVSLTDGTARDPGRKIAALDGGWAPRVKKKDLRVLS